MATTTNGNGQRTPLHSTEAPKTPATPGRPTPKIGTKVNNTGGDSTGDSTTARERLLDSVDAFLAWLKGFFIPPAVLVERPAGWTELTDYAFRNVRVARAPGLIKFFSLAWFWVVVAPSVTWARFKEWVLVRPMRALLFIGIAELFIRTTPVGAWIAAGIRGFYAGLAWLLLP